MNIRLIIFDFDGTLGDTRKNIVKTMRMTIEELGLAARSEEQCASTIGLPLAGCFAALFPDMSPTDSQQCAETYRRIFAENLLSMKPQPFPQVCETLAELHRQGYMLTIASSRSKASLIELTQDMGIAGYISFLIGADDVKEAKPRPEPVLKTLEAMQIGCDEALVVGDMEVDILMGFNAGTKTCGVTWGNGKEEGLRQAGADFIIHKMEEIFEVVGL